MKISELIKKLEEIPNKEAEIRVQHWTILRKTDKVLLNWSNLTDVLVPVDGVFDVITLETEAVEEEL